MPSLKRAAWHAAALFESLAGSCPKKESSTLFLSAYFRQTVVAITAIQKEKNKSRLLLLYN